MAVFQLVSLLYNVYSYVVTETPKSNPFHSSPFTPRMSAGPSRVQTEKSFFGVDVKKSPAATACNTPVRTPVKKEILAFTVSTIIALNFGIIDSNNPDRAADKEGFLE